MLIVSENYNELYSIVKNEASGRKIATDLISSFIAELTRIKNEFGNDLSKEAAVLNRTIGSLIRSWSDTCAVAYSRSVVAIIHAGYNNVLSTKSNSANFRKWLSTLNYKNESDARSAVFAMAQACTGKDSRYTSPKDFRDLYMSEGIDIDFNSIPMIIRFIGGYSSRHRSFIEEQIKSAQSPFYYEHYIPVDQIRSQIYSIVEKHPKNMQEQISSALTCMLVCWITGYENSRIADESKTFREDPFEVYSNARIQLFANKDGTGEFKSSNALKRYISQQLELDNQL